MKVAYLPLESRISERADLEVLITHEDLTETTANTTQKLTIPIAAKMGFEVSRAILDENFEDTTDAAFNTTTLIVGDDGSTSRFLASMELNVNGTEVPLKNGTGTNLVYATTDTIDFVFASMSGKSLSALNKGRVRLLCKVNDERGVPAAV